MRLSDNLHSFLCWDELVDQCQGELKFVDEVRSYFSQRKKLEEEFAENIRRLDNQYTKQCNNLSTGYCKDTWIRLLEQSTSAADCMSKGVQTFENEILPEIAALSEKKKRAIIELVTTKNRLESQIALVGKDITKLQSSIEDFAKATEINKIKYEESARGRVLPEYNEKYKTRFVTNAAKLQEYNNDYNILLNVVAMHEVSYIQHILPAWLDHHQHLLSTQINDIKSLLRYSFEVLLHHDESYTMVMSNVYSLVSKLNFDTEYKTFYDRHDSCPMLAPSQQEFDTSLQKLTSLNLPIKQLIVNELTDSTLRAKLDAHKTDLQHIDERLTVKSTKLIELETKAEKEVQDALRKLNVKAHIHELSVQRCRYQMTVDFINRSLEMWEGKPLEPFYNLLPVTLDPVKGSPLTLPATLNLTQSMMLPQCLGAVSPGLERKPSAANTLMKIRNMFTLGRQASLEPPPRDLNLGTPVVMKWEEDEDKDYVIMTKEDNVSNESGSTNEEEELGCPKILLDPESNDSLENQPWFHDDITRQETADLLQLKGQFLLRKTIDSKRRTAVLVLSVNTGHTRIKHFIMQINDKGQFRLEGSWFGSIQQLLNYHITTDKPITNRMPVGIRQAVLRDRWNLHHRDVRLKQFLGKGNFGDVYQAQLVLNNREVAVKTCRDPDSFREKFLEEADTLKKFNHKNVVKLLGICSDEMPYYIVMEFMNNGSLLAVLQEGPLQTIKQLVHYCEQAAAGMLYLHSQNYIHRDLAARNCLVHNQTSLKISDFGMSRYQGENSVYISKMKLIPIRWTAPESLMFRTYTFKSDIWSYGILMWEIFNKGQYPYSEMSNRDVKDQIDAGYRLPKSRDTPANMYQIMLDCWKYEPKGRPSFDEIHKIVKDIYIENYAEISRVNSFSSTCD